MKKWALLLTLVLLVTSCSPASPTESNVRDDTEHTLTWTCGGYTLTVVMSGGIPYEGHCMDQTEGIAYVQLPDETRAVMSITNFGGVLESNVNGRRPGCGEELDSCSFAFGGTAADPLIRYTMTAEKIPPSEIYATNVTCQYGSAWVTYSDGGSFAFAPARQLGSEQMIQLGFLNRVTTNGFTALKEGAVMTFAGRTITHENNQIVIDNVPCEPMPIVHLDWEIREITAVPDENIPVLGCDQTNYSSVILASLGTAYYLEINQTGGYLYQGFEIPNYEFTPLQPVNYNKGAMTFFDAADTEVAQVCMSESGIGIAIP